LANLTAEFALVKDWRANGEDITSAPDTPCFDRCQTLCTLAELDFGNYLQALRTSTDRNVLCHHPPPRIEDHLNADNTVNWRSLYEAGEDCRRRIQRDHRSGRLTNDRFHLFSNMIDWWFASYVRGWDQHNKAIPTHSSISATTSALKAVANRLTVAETSPPPEPYEPGKWDIIPHDE
ncbi:hypothetical protein BGZ61DRAFT_548387, partial [Ilyonectria robusta]|uniref:uncharacterized protein n=1 Tax=Ilyonectria robusta TaxID=1079257 RepID=UPI001E8DA3ED